MNYNAAPTKSNLIKSKDYLEFSKKGYELLDKKRTVLIREIMKIIEESEEIRRKIGMVFEEAYTALRMANINLGINNVEDISESIDKIDEYEILYKSVMGVEVPIVKINTSEFKNTYGMYRTNAALDMAVVKFREAKVLTYKLAEMENAIIKLAFEVKKTQKRANSLEKIQIPKYTFLSKNIQERLEEKEREDFFRLKVTKKKAIK